MQPAGSIIMTFVLMAVAGQIHARPRVIRDCPPGVNQLGYIRHETDCDKFVQCHKDANGVMYGEEQQCAFSTYWDMALLNCVNVDETTCPTDKCANLPDGHIMGAEGNCRGYWSCSAGKAKPYCCPVGQIYNETLGCVEDVDLQCNETCFNDFVNRSCDTRPVADSRIVYEQDLGNGHYITMPCPPGTEYDEDKCGCEASISKPEPFVPRCKPVVHMSFTNDIGDESINRNYIETNNVFVADGVAIFNETDSYISIPALNNIGWMSTLVIKAKYQSNLKYDDFEERAFLSNCFYSPSIQIRESPEDITFLTKTTAGGPVSVTVSQQDDITAMKEIEFRLEGNALVGSIGTVFNSTVALGTLVPAPCPLTIGQTRGLAPFNGVVDEISVYTCNPDY